MEPHLAQALLQAQQATAAAPRQAPPLTPAPEPLFLVTLPKTTSTVFSAMLGQHPMVTSLPELNLFTGETVQDWADQPGHRIFCDGLLRSVAQIEFGMQTDLTVSAALAWLQMRAGWPVAGLFDHLRDRVAPAILLDQSPLYSAAPGHLARILQAYPRARFIRLVRNPVAWAQSMARWGAAGDAVLRLYPEAAGSPHGPIDPMSVWVGANRRLDAALAPLPDDQRITVLGEDVLTRPTEVMTDLLHWLDLSAEQALLDRMLHPEESVFACWGPAGARGGNNPDFLSAPNLRVRTDRDRLMRLDHAGANLPPEVIELAAAYGYAV